MKALPTVVVGLGGVGFLWTVVRSASNPLVYLNAEGLLFVSGGALVATVLSFPYEDLARALRDGLAKLRSRPVSLARWIDLYEDLAETLIVRGVDSLEERLQSDALHHPYVRLGVGLVVDQLPLEKIEKVLDAALTHQQERDLVAARVVRSLAKFSPAFGMAGTLVGMIAMFQEMGTNLDGIGPAMAIAMMTTFYGLLLANIVFTPFAIKLERGVEGRALEMSLMLEGTLLLARKTPPALLRQELSTFLDPQELDPQESAVELD